MNHKYMRETEEIMNSQANSKWKIKTQTRKHDSGHFHAEIILVCTNADIIARACALGVT